MKNFPHKIISVIALMLVSVLSTAQNNEALLDSLDFVVHNKKSYFIQKESHLNFLKSSYKQSRNNKDKFEILESIIEEYKVYSVDSMLVYAQKCKEMTGEFDNLYYKQAANMHYAEALYLAGMYKESSDLLGMMTVEKIDKKLLPTWYHILHTLYTALYENARENNIKAHYLRLANAYADSILSVNDKDSFVYNIVSSDIYVKQGNCMLAKQFIDNIDISKLNQHNAAIYSYCMASICHCTGNIDEEIYWLAKSSMLEIPVAVREYSALQQLALLLYKKGEIERSYLYITSAMNDIVDCHFKMREDEITTFFPIIESAYRKEIDTKNQQLIITIAIISLSIIFLILLLIAERKHLRKIQELKDATEHNNKELERAVSQLNEVNSRYEELNADLNESNRIKIKYITQYMTICSMYAENLCQLKTKIKSITRNDPALKSKLSKVLDERQVDEILDEFYYNFDSTFLSLFPNFITQFNSLLEPDKRIDPPETPNTLNTPFRIYALIRLGMTDSEQISQFLRYSLSTIYNYRVKIRNSALVDRDKLDELVMEIQ